MDPTDKEFDLILGDLNPESNMNRQENTIDKTEDSTFLSTIAENISLRDEFELLQLIHPDKPSKVGSTSIVGTATGQSYIVSLVAAEKKLPNNLWDVIQRKKISMHFPFLNTFTLVVTDKRITRHFSHRLWHDELWNFSLENGK